MTPDAAAAAAAAKMLRVHRPLSIVNHRQAGRAAGLRRDRRQHRSDPSGSVRRHLLSVSRRRGITVGVTQFSAVSKDADVAFALWWTVARVRLCLLFTQIA